MYFKIINGSSIYPLALHYQSNRTLRIIVFIVLVGCKTNASQTGSTVIVNEETTTIIKETIPIIPPSKVNPDDCTLTIKIISIREQLIEGAIVEIIERGFGFKDYLIFFTNNSPRVPVL